MSDLPTQTPTYQELKKLLEAIYDIQTQSSIQKDILKNLSFLNDIYIDIQYPSYKEKQIIDILQSKGAICIQNLKHIKTHNYAKQIAGTDRQALQRRSVKRKAGR